MYLSVYYSFDEEKGRSHNMCLTLSHQIKEEVDIESEWE